MKKSQIFTIVTFSVAALLLTGVLVVGLNTDGFHFGKWAEEPMGFHNAEKIELTGDEAVELVDISWVEGPVTVGRSPDGNIYLTESAHREIGEEDAMSASFSGGKLTVRWDGQWFRRWINWSIFNFGSSAKELEVLIPGDGALDGISISNTSGDVTVEGFSGEEMNFSSTSGDLRLKGLAVEKQLNTSTVSGDIVLDGVRAGELNASTTSGELEMEAMEAEKLNISTTSGECVYSGGAKELHASTVSGEMEFALTECPAQAELESVSGDVTLALPDNDGFTANYSSVSGEFESEFPTTGSKGKHDGTAVYGTGSAKLRFSTTSGEMEINRRNG